MENTELRALDDSALEKKIADLGIAASERDSKGGLTERGCAAMKDRLPLLAEQERRQREREKQEQADAARAIAQKIEDDKQRINDLRTLGVQSL